MIYFVFQDPEDENKFYYLYKKYNKLLYKVAIDILHNHQDAEDAIQISLETIYRYFYKIRGEIEKKCVGYMVMIVRNKSIDLFNARKKVVITDKDVFNQDFYQKSESEVSLFNNYDLKEGINKLEEKYRVVLVLKYIYGFSIREIAGMLSISETNVSTRLDRGRKQLKKYLNLGVNEHENK